MPDDQSHYGVIDGRILDTPPPKPIVPYRDYREMWAAAVCLLQDGADMLVRCRVEKERQYLRDNLVEFATLSLREWHDYWGRPYPEGLREQLDAAMTEAEARARAA